MSDGAPRATSQLPPMQPIRRAVCPHCGERIGVYEPTIVIDPGGRTRISSLAREPHLLDITERMFHARGDTSNPADPPDPA